MGAAAAGAGTTVMVHVVAVPLLLLLLLLLSGWKLTPLMLRRMDTSIWSMHSTIDFCNDVKKVKTHVFR